MSTVLRPAGPEPAQTYWMRRIAVIGAVIVVLAVAVALIANGTSSGSAVQADPAPLPPAALTVAASPTASPTASAPSSPGSSATPTSTSARPSSPSSTTTSTTTSSSPTATAQPTRKPTPTPPAKPAACPAGSLRPTLTGPQRLRPKQQATFTLSLINGSGQDCTATVDGGNFALRVYSGSDRIWSTRDCATSVTPLRRTLEAEQAMAWKLTWNGRRSRAGCASRPEIPRPGTYYAIAQLKGAEPVRLLITLRG